LVRRQQRRRSAVRPPFRIVALTAVAAALLGASSVDAAPGHSAGAPRIEVLSVRSDLIAGGVALVVIDLPRGTGPHAVSVTLSWRGHRRPRRRNLKRMFALRKNGLYEGLVTGLPAGRSRLAATVRRAGRRPASARITLTNHPNGGPLFSGPQIQPWICQKGAVDRKCDEPVSYSYVYWPTGSNPSFQPYDPKHPPSDLATTTTDQGVRVPFIVRIETGYEDRDQYRIATLFVPGKAWRPWAPQKQWNHKLLITHGASCGGDFGAYSSPSVTSFNPADYLGLPFTFPHGVIGDSAQYALGAGFAVMSTDLDNNGDDCNVVVQAESLVMAKQHLIDAYGPLRYTIGTGCSGGSLAQQWIANAYPGIYQGILPTCSFPDTWSTATQVVDYHLLNAYFGDSSEWGAAIAWSPTQMAAVEGNALPVDSIVSDQGFFSAAEPTGDCWPLKNSPATAKLLYNAQTNPGGVRCGIADYALNVFGRRSPTVWTPQERRIGHGFAGLALDNVGVQYGLSALQSGQITPAQFVDLNAKIGGLDIDANLTAKRLAADEPALAYAYRSGMINEANNLDQTAIIDCRGPDPGAAHDAYRAFAVRARLDRAHGTHANQMIWEGPTPIIGDDNCMVASFMAMDRWLTAVERDHSSRPIVQKLVADKPPDIQDECFDGNGNKVSNGQCPPGVVPVYGTPRTVAGDAITTDANKCQLRPLRRSDYGLLLTDSEWAQLQQLFPDGVCDYSKPGVSQQPTIPWLTYQTASGKVVYGGRPLKPPPAGSGGGWASSAFAPSRY
jgi:Tannase-like family of unknown function (DUF6351)